MGKVGLWDCLGGLGEVPPRPERLRIVFMGKAHHAIFGITESGKMNVRFRFQPSSRVGIVSHDRIITL